MRKLSFAILLLLAIVPFRLHADTYDERTLVLIQVPDQADRDFILSSRIDVVNARATWVKALLRPSEFALVEQRGLYFEVLKDEMAADRALWKAADDAAARVAMLRESPEATLNRLPSAYYTASKFNTTNPASGTLMEHLLALYNAHPDICRLYNLGATQDGAYDIIAMKVSKNPDTLEAEPKIRIYGNIHGDEKIGCMVAADVLDTILAGYTALPQNATAKALVDGTEMWFIPMGNPYGNANNVRWNSHSVDLNRNFWTPYSGGPDDCYPATTPCVPWTENETKAIRDLTEAATADHPKKRFAVSISFHAGEICFNSVWNYTPTAPADEPIFWSARTPGSGCTDTNGCLTLAPNGLAKAFQNGCTKPSFWYTDGYDWYGTNGDTNDWAYGAWTDLDTTVELDITKTPTISDMQADLGYFRQAVLNYMTKAFQGVSGVMTDASTGAPIDGTVSATCTASANVPVPHAYPAVYTDPVKGDFHRVLQPGTYTIVCSASGYTNTTLTGVVVTADTTSTANCALTCNTLPNLAYSASALTDACSGTGSGGDGVLDPGETGTLQITLANTGTCPATGVSATLSTSTSGITVTQATGSFPNIAGNGTGLSVSPHFQFSVASGVACGTVINFSLHIVSSQGSWDSPFTVKVGTISTGAPTTAYSEAFTGVTVPALPAGWTVWHSSGTDWVTNSGGCTGNALRYPGLSTGAANSWAFTPGITLTAGTTYTLAFNEKVVDT
jgi:uncharacterized repeat protein (TIGR01451 family)